MNADKKIILKIYLLFIPVAFFSYLFHEFGHWSIGELLGNDMTYSLNYVWPKTESYINANHNLYVLIGGPAFTIFLAMFFLFIIEKYATLHAYPFVFFQLVCQVFSLGDT